VALKMIMKVEKIDMSLDTILFVLSDFENHGGTNPYLPKVPTPEDKPAYLGGKPFWLTARGRGSLDTRNKLRTRFYRRLKNHSLVISIPVILINARTRMIPHSVAPIATVEKSFCIGGM